MSSGMIEDRKLVYSTDGYRVDDKVTYTEIITQF